MAGGFRTFGGLGFRVRGAFVLVAGPAHVLECLRLLLRQVFKRPECKKKEKGIYLVAILGQDTQSNSPGVL